MSKIFCIGLSRTGTSSLTYALEILGYKIIHHPRPSFMPEILNIIDKYDGAADSPIAYYYRELNKIYPNSKFISTERNLKSWLASVKNILNILAFNKDFRDNKLRELLYGDVRFNKEKYVESFNRHYKNIDIYFEDKSVDLLKINIIKGDGWNKLCPFLNKDIPDIPFPYKHKLL